MYMKKDIMKRSKRKKNIIQSVILENINLMCQGEVCVNTYMNKPASTMKYTHRVKTLKR